MKSKKEIESIVKDYEIENYTINDDLTVDVDGSVDLSSKGLTKLPVRFGSVNGGFVCDYNGLTTLEGSPYLVKYQFSCFDNQLTDLKGCPLEVGGFMDVGNNKIETLDYVPNSIGTNELHIDWDDGYLIKDFDKISKMNNRKKIMKKIVHD